MGEGLQRILLTPRESKHSQRHVIFRTRCTINKNVCNMIIDSDSSENVVFKSVVKAMGLPTKKHPNPYKVRWIKKGSKSRVIDTCKVSLTNENSITMT